MSALKKKLSGLFGMAMLFTILAATAAKISAASPGGAPDADKEIGTRAVVTFKSDDGMSHEVKSNLVVTRIKQVYKVALDPMIKSQTVKPGDEVQVPFAVRNLGNGVDTINIRLKDLPHSATDIVLSQTDAAGRVVNGNKIAVTGSAIQSAMLTLAMVQARARSCCRLSAAGPSDRRPRSAFTRRAAR